MPSRVTIFHNTWGVPIAELSTSTTRSWILNGIGRCQFTLASLTDPNCTRETLQYGNLVRVEHIPTIDEAGNRRGKLPDWFGVILPPQEWDTGLLTVTAYSAEILLKYRPLPYVTVQGSAGAIAQQILSMSKQFGGFHVFPGDIYLDSSENNVDLRLSAFEELYNLAQAHNQDFDVSGAIKFGNRLQLELNWYDQKGVQALNGFSEGTGGNMRLPRLTEQGEIVNVTEGYNTSLDPSTRLHATAENDDSISLYNRLGQNTNFMVDGQAALQAATTSYNNLHLNPRITLELVALDVGQTFDDLVTGNLWKVVLKSVGFYAGSIGFKDTVRITGVEYDDATNEAKLATDNLMVGKAENYYA